jgi:hypothetical protein
MAERIYDIAEGVLPEHPETTVVKWLGSLASPDAAALTAAWLSAVGRVRRLGDHCTYLDTDGPAYHLKVYDGTTWQTIV